MRNNTSTSHTNRRFTLVTARQSSSLKLRLLGPIQNYRSNSTCAHTHTLSRNTPANTSVTISTMASRKVCNFRFIARTIRLLALPLVIQINFSLINNKRISCRNNYFINTIDMRKVCCCFLWSVSSPHLTWLITDL